MGPDELKKKQPDFFLRALKEARTFTDDLFAENKRLRDKLAEAAAEEERLRAELAEVSQSSEVKELLRERKALLMKLEGFEDRQDKVKLENDEFNRRFYDVEDLNNRLANLYIASLRLHGSLQHDVVLKTAVEIIVNLVGAHDFAIYLADHKHGTLRMIASEGVLGTPLSAISLEAGRIGEAARRREVYINEAGSGEPHDPLACIPLVIESQLVGMVVIFSLLPQKEGRFDRADHEMFELLAAHAAAAIAAASLYSRAESRLKTVEGYVSLLKSSLHRRPS